MSCQQIIQTNCGSTNWNSQQSSSIFSLPQQHSKIIIWISTDSRFSTWVATILQQIIGQQNSPTRINSPDDWQNCWPWHRKTLESIWSLTMLSEYWCSQQRRPVPHTWHTPQKDFSTNAAAFACLQVSLAVKQVTVKHFQSTLDLLSQIECILLDRSADNLPEPCKYNLGQIFPEQTITYDFAANYWNWTLAWRIYLSPTRTLWQSAT